MKKVLFIACLILSTTVNAQNYSRNSQQTNHSYYVMGRIVAIDRPITQTVQRQCNNYQDNYQRDNYQRQSSDLNAGTIVGAIVGGAIGSRVGKGSGRDVAIGIGSAAGAMIGNQNNRNHSNCSSSYEEIIVGYVYIARYENLEIRGQMRNVPQIGQPVQITIRSTFTIEDSGIN